MAADLDSLQRHIDEHGSVVPKQADVWGQARLSRHREQFEAQMSEELTKFNSSLQGALARSDQAYFANALALSAAASGDSTTKNAQSTTVQTNLADPNTLISSPATDATLITRNGARSATAAATVATGGLSLEPSIMLDQKKRYLDHLNEIRRTNEGDDRADSPGYALHLIRLPVSVLPGRVTDQGYGAEITFSIKPYLTPQLLPTTFRNLVVNDVMEQLAFPITKLINDKDARKALNEYAEVKIELLRKLTDEIPSLKMTQAAEWKKAKTYEEIKAFASNTPAASGFLDEVDGEIKKAWNNEKEKVAAQATVQALKTKSGNQSQNVKGDQVLKALNQWNKSNRVMDTASFTQDHIKSFLDSPAINHLSLSDSYKKDFLEEMPKQLLDAKLHEDEAIRVTKDQLEKLKEAFEKIISDLNKSNLAFSLVPTRQRTARFALPPSQYKCVLGEDCLRTISRHILNKLENELNEKKIIQLSDVQGLLQDEVIAAHSFLSSLGTIWDVTCTEPFAKLIRQNDCCRIEDVRQCYNCSAKAFFLKCCKTKENADLMTALGWCVLVESTLLNQQLVDDIKETAITKGNPELKQYSGQWLPFYQPDITGTANEAFQAYVKCRWPVQVFALDPVTQDQNIADRFSARREMQLAMSLAFVSGNMSARNLTRYTRRIEIDMDTIDLNRTAVGFSHGDSTFGWRFYPRFQSPDIESNLKVLTRDLLCGGPSRDDLLRQRRLEPGPRECVALVIMPSFVPYVTIDSTSNWFCLTNPRHKVMDHKNAMQLSRAVRAIQSCSGNVNDMQCYREGEWERLVERSKQLESRLPTQTMMSQVPFENTLGGFEMFNNGITDLAPELYGFYGEPGIKSEGRTTLFLVGNHFSVLNTKTIVGGLAMVGSAGLVTAPPPVAAAPAAASGTAATATPAPASSTSTPIITQTLLSRQVMMITVDVPANDKLTVLPNKNIDVHVATPYGVSRHLEIPLYPIEKKEEPKAAAGFSWKDPTVLTAKIVYDKKNPNSKPEVAIETTPKIKDFELVDTTETVNKFQDTLPVSLKFNLVAVTADGAEFKLNDEITIPSPTQFKKNKFSLPFETPTPGSLQEAILTALKTVPQSKNVVLVRLVGFIKFANDAQPITKIENAITIKVITSEK
ncbi:MAG: hypothetical protein QM703_25960 [Gemmatales bacterium]